MLSAVSATERFSTGASVAWRSVSDRDRAVHTVIPVTVVHDDNFVALYRWAGSTYKRRRGIRGGPGNRQMIQWDGGHEDRVWHSNDALVLYRPGDPFSLWAFWRCADREFLGWYVNLEQPWRRTSIGFDSRDRILDLAISPDRSEWQWKDEEEFAWAVERGVFSPSDVQAFHADGERAVRAVIAREQPFTDAWRAWLLILRGQRRHYPRAGVGSNPDAPEETREA